MKKFLLTFCVFFSSFSFAQNKEEIGVTLAKCTGWYLSAVELFKNANRPSDARNSQDFANVTGNIATKFIGLSRTQKLAADIVAMNKSNNANKDPNEWMPKLLNMHNDFCPKYSQKNEAYILREMQK
jgi:hypothetical protein